jgi:hypothetical protein
MKKLPWGAIVLLSALAASWALAGPRGIVKNFDYGDGRSGAIDYDGGFVEATATGTADMRKMANDAQAEMVARRTARHMAYEVLAETVGKIQVASKTLYQDAIATVDALKVETHAVIRGAHIMRDSVEWRESRRTKEGYPLATVTLRLHLTGREGLGHLLDKHVPANGFQPSNEESSGAAADPDPPSKPSPAAETATGPRAPVTVPDRGNAPTVVAGKEPSPPPAPVEKASAPAPETEARFSSLIVDTSGLASGYTPAIREYIRDESGQLVYGPDVARASIAREGRRPLRYASTLDEAKTMFAATGRPIIVQAVGTAAPGEVTISAADAQAIRQANMAEQFLRDARVVLVLE